MLPRRAHGPRRRARDVRPHVARRRPAAGRSDAAVDRLARPADACRAARSVAARSAQRARGEARAAARSGRRPTMKDVARVAGVSLATVSRVVNGNGDVRPELSERVQGAVQMLGYRRDMSATTLRRADRQSASIGLIIEDVSNPFFSAVHRGVEEVARARGVLTFVGSSDELEDRERELAEAFAARGVDGLVIVPCAGDQSYLLRDRQAGTALVFVDRPPRYIPGHA